MVDQQNAIFPVVTFCPEPKSKYKVKEDILKVIILVTVYVYKMVNENRPMFL